MCPEPLLFLRNKDISVRSVILHEYGNPGHCGAWLPEPHPSSRSYRCKAAASDNFRSARGPSCDCGTLENKTNGQRDGLVVRALSVNSLNSVPSARQLQLRASDTSCFMHMPKCVCTYVYTCTQMCAHKCAYKYLCTYVHAHMTIQAQN